MDPLLIEFLGVLARSLLNALGVWLVAHHVLSTDQSERYVTAFAHDVVLALPAIGALAWGLWVRYRGKQKLLVALSSDVKMSENEVTAIVKSGAVTPTVTTPKDTIPGVPLPASAVQSAPSSIIHIK